MIISRTPFRISFFGGGTDYPQWYNQNNGSVLSTTINKYIYITCRWLPPFFNHKYRIAYSKVEDVLSPIEIKHPAIRVVLKNYESSKGIELHSDADLPARSGLGSSSSFIVGLLNAIEALHGRRVSAYWLSKQAIYYEQNILCENVGSQDQVAAAFGGLNVIKFQKDGSINVQPITISSKRKEELNVHLMLFFTGFARSASEIAQEQIKNIKNTDISLRKMYEMVYDALDILTSNTDICQFGEMLHDSWELKRKLSNKITNDHIDEIYDRARKAGAVGGKLLGAGGGGFIIFFAKPEKQNDIKKALYDLLYVPFEMENTGSQIIYFNE